MRNPPLADPPVVEQAPAKLNLDLILTGRRPNGYHELDSVVVFTDAGDELRLAPASELEVVCEGPFAADVPGGDANIVRRAVLQLAEAVGAAPRVQLRLDKRLPVASGIGGGSADAAAALRGLARLWHMPLHTPVLAEVALSLGSDVLACLRSRPARMRGIGEIVEPLPNARELEVVLANPGRPLATSEVFAAVRPERFGRRENALPAASDWAWLQGSRNDLELSARALMPVIAELLATLAARPGCRLARMSGSGPTCFGLFDHPSEARAAAAEIAAAEPGWWVTACRTGPGE